MKHRLLFAYFKFNIRKKNKRCAGIVSIMHRVDMSLLVIAVPGRSQVGSPAAHGHDGSFRTHLTVRVVLEIEVTS